MTSKTYDISSQSVSWGNTWATWMRKHNLALSLIQKYELCNLVNTGVNPIDPGNTRKRASESDTIKMEGLSVESVPEAVQKFKEHLENIVSKIISSGATLEEIQFDSEWDVNVAFETGKSEAEIAQTQKKYDLFEYALQYRDEILELYRVSEEECRQKQKENLESKIAELQKQLVKLG